MQGSGGPGREPARCRPSTAVRCGGAELWWLGGAGDGRARSRPGHGTDHARKATHRSGRFRPGSVCAWRRLGTLERAAVESQATGERARARAVAVVALRRATLVDEGHIMEEDCIAVVIDRPLVNIDDPFELELAEWMLERETTK